MKRHLVLQRIHSLTDPFASRVQHPSWTHPSIPGRNAQHFACPSPQGSQLLDDVSSTVVEFALLLLVHPKFVPHLPSSAAW